MRRLGAILTAVMSLAACSAAYGAGPPPVPRSWFGLTTEDVFAGDATYRDATLTNQASVGVGAIRQTFHWDQLEPSRDVYNFAGYDSYVAALARHGMQLTALLFGEPSWASTRPSGVTGGTFPPKDPNDIAQFATTLVRRYGPGGSFWAANPTVPVVPIREWQIWNEPNLKAFWMPSPDAAAYTALLRAVSSAIRAVDPGATIDTAGLPNSTISGSISRDTFISSMYAAGAKGTFTALAVNRYGQDDAVVPTIESTRSLMNANGDGSAIVVSETGWATGGPAGTATVGEPGQAMDIKCSLLKVAMRRTDLNVSGYVYYDWKDATPYSSDFWGLHTGLRRIDGTAKPGYGAYAGMAHQLQAPPTGNWAPRSCFSASTLRPYTNEVVTFTSTSVDADGTITGQAWDLRNAGTFGDGTGTQASWSWAAPGTYLVRLRAADNAGGSDISTQEITVRNRPPTASFTSSPSSPTVGATVTFTSTSKDADGTIVSQAWDLDNDGSYDDGTATTATRTFSAAGTYTVRLRVVDDLGAAATTSRTITVS